MVAKTVKIHTTKKNNKHTHTKTQKKHDKHAHPVFAHVLVFLQENVNGTQQHNGIF
jgi:hypothetical protein